MPGCSIQVVSVIPGVYAAGNTMAAPSGSVYPGGGHPIGTSMVFSHRAVLDMLEGAHKIATWDSVDHAV